MWWETDWHCDILCLWPIRGQCGDRDDQWEARKWSWWHFRPGVTRVRGVRGCCGEWENGFYWARIFNQNIAPSGNRIKNLTGTPETELSADIFHKFSFFNERSNYCLKHWAIGNNCNDRDNQSERRESNNIVIGNIEIGSRGERNNLIMIFRLDVVSRGRGLISGKLPAGPGGPAIMTGRRGYWRGWQQGHLAIVNQRFVQVVKKSGINLQPYQE